MENNKDKDSCWQFTKENDTNKKVLLSVLRNPFARKYCEIMIESKDLPDVERIINEKSNYIAKAEYYERAYNDNLVLNSCSDIRISSVRMIDSLRDVL